MEICETRGCMKLLGHGGLCDPPKRPAAHQSRLSNHDLAAVAKRAIADFKRGNASPWRLVSLIEELTKRLGEIDA